MFKVFFALFLFQSLSFGFDKTHCTQSGVKRSVEIEKAGTSLTPCRVIYSKEKGDPLELWKAENDFNFCEEKAKGFVDKLKNLGWDCK